MFENAFKLTIGTAPQANPAVCRGIEMNTGMILMAIFIAAVITFFLRALPFAVYHKRGRMPQKLVYLGKILPSSIRAVLVVYCLKDVYGDWPAVGIPKLIAVGIVAVSYKWRHNTLFGIMAGTVCYMVILYMV